MEDIIFKKNKTMISILSDISQYQNMNIHSAYLSRQWGSVLGKLIFN